MVSCLMGDSTALASAIVRCCLKKTTIAKRRPLSYSRINSPVFVSRANLPICSHTISANITVGEWTIFSQATVRNSRSPWDVTLSPIKVLPIVVHPDFRPLEPGANAGFHRLRRLIGRQEFRLLLLSRFGRARNAAFVFVLASIHSTAIKNFLITFYINFSIKIWKCAVKWEEPPSGGGCSSQPAGAAAAFIF